jgi:hypothetical protein
VERNYDLDYSNQPNWYYIVPPPEGMSHSQWVDSVMGAGENAVRNDSTRDYHWRGGDGGVESGNCHVATGNILSDAAGTTVNIPYDQRPPRYAPGLPVAPPPPPPPVDWSRKACCFHASTPVRTTAGAFLIARLPSSCRDTPVDVASTAGFERMQDKECHNGIFRLLCISLDNGEVLRVTAQHPFFDGERFVPSQHLQPGDRLATVDGGFRSVCEITRMSRQPLAVYNLRTDSGTYAVGRAGVIVGGHSLAAEIRRRRRELVAAKAGN